MKKWLLVFIWTLLLVFCSKKILAYDLTLTKIGTLSTIGADYSLVSYVGSIPSLEGTATPAATVAVAINAVSVDVVAATASGVWTFTPTSLNMGDNSVVISSGSQSIDFVIRYNLTTTPTASISAVTELPDSGVWEGVVLVVVGGLGVLYFGHWLKKQMSVWERGS